MRCRLPEAAARGIGSPICCENSIAAKASIFHWIGEPSNAARRAGTNPKAQDNGLSARPALREDHSYPSVSPPLRERARDKEESFPQGKQSEETLSQQRLVNRAALSKVPFRTRCDSSK